MGASLFSGHTPTPSAQFPPKAEQFEETLPPPNPTGQSRARSALSRQQVMGPPRGMKGHRKSQRGSRKPMCRSSLNLGTLGWRGQSPLTSEATEASHLFPPAPQTHSAPPPPGLWAPRGRPLAPPTGRPARPRAPPRPRCSVPFAAPSLCLPGRGSDGVLPAPSAPGRACALGHFLKPSTRGFLPPPR